MASKRRSTKRRSSKRRLSPKMISWTKKLMAWRKANKHKDGSLPSLKAAMKACKGRSSRRSKCRKSSGRKTSKRRSSKRKSMKGGSWGGYDTDTDSESDYGYDADGGAKRRSRRRSSKRRSSKRRTSKRRSSKRRTSKRRTSKRRSSKRRTSKKRRSSKRRSSKRRSSKRRTSKRRSSKRRSSKRRSYRKMKGGYKIVMTPKSPRRASYGTMYMSPASRSWNEKLQEWREMNRKADGSLPSMKAAMKACKGRAPPEKKCRKTSRYGKYRNPEQFCNDNGFFRPVVHPSLKAELEAKIGKKPLMLTL